MSLSQQLETQLDRISDGAADFIVQLEAPFGRLEAKLSEVNDLACTFMSIRYQGDWLADLQESQLRQLGVWFAQRVTYLLEPLSVIELDSISRTLQMRSKSPTRQPDKRAYFELAISPRGGITMRRMMKTAGEPRQSIPATVTREVLLRLCEDIAASGDCLCQQTEASG